MTLTRQEIINAGLDIISIGEVTNGPPDPGIVETRLARLIKTLSKVIQDAEYQANAVFAALGFEPPLPFANGIDVDRRTLTVEFGGNIYAPVLAEIPFSTTATFDPAQWRLVAGLTALDLSSSTPGEGAGLIGLESGKTVQDLAEASPIYQDAAGLKDFTINGTPATDGSFVRVLTEDINDAYAPAYPSRQAPTDLGECMLMPTTDESALSIAQDFPYVTVAGVKRRIFPLDIRTNLFNTPMSIPLFRPRAYNSSGFLTFEYIGEKPLHVLVKGSMSFLIRTGALLTDSWSETLLRLNPINPPHQELGQGGGRRNLAGFMGSFGTSEQMTSYTGINDLCQPVTPALVAASAGYTKISALPVVNGFFNPGDTTEALRTEDGGVPVGPNVRTTAWMDISSYDKLKTCFYLHGTGNSTRRRVQVKNAAGAIKTASVMSIDRTGAYEIYRFNPEDAQVRIYYSSATDDAVVEGFRVLPQSVSAEYDPVKGYWIQRNLNVNREVVFYPGVVYYFDMFTTVFDGGSAREWGFRLQSGGMNFLFDVGNLRKDFALNTYTGGI